ncbi:hypothetical protein PGT21_001930 [Puccinia graminis f. sp. tritici]|uniref:G-patch domain-containing protein n=2 Tax=Puccinia graminis f. sp. tritici TaxID=56615 RepID=A0A5B0PJ07_PUCGR|nr:hypothetical protein PGT21_001930 [Puccinia graminis f. sp. tritici]
MSFKFGAFSGSSAGGNPSSSIGGGGGLYAGISLGGSTPAKKNTDEPAEKSAADSAQPATAALDPSIDRPNVDQDERSANTDNSKDDTKKDDEKSKASSWSSSLRFAPVIRKQPAKSTTKPFAVPFSATVSVTTKSGLAATAFAPDDEHEVAPSNSTSRTMHIPGRAKAALNAPAPAAQTSKAPSVFARKGGFLAAHAPERIPGSSNTSGAPAGTLSTSTAMEKVDSSIPGFKHSFPAMLAQTTTLKGLVPSNNSGNPNKLLKKKLEQPPPLTLPDDEFGTGGGGDVNGFAQSEAGRKLALRAARNSKKSKKKGKTREVDPAILFMEDYDPARPNDYNEWMNFIKRRREERREALRLERQRQQRQEREEMSESSYYSSDDDGSGSDDARAAPRGNFFAPPAEYHEPSAKDEDNQRAPSTGPLPSIARAETGDEAYARRVALSQGISHNPPQHVTGTEISMTESATSIEAPPTSAAPIVSVADAQARAKLIAERLQRLRDSNNEASDGPPASGNDTHEIPSFVPPQLAPHPPPTLLEAQAKAKVIAAKLAALNGMKSSTSGTARAPHALPQSNQESAPLGPTTEAPNKAPGQPDFARRLMDKYGWKEGQGLGANESGRTSILTVAAGSSGPGGNKKRKENPGDSAMAGPTGPHKIGSMAKGRGVVIDDAKSQRDLEEKIRYGEPTRIVYLTNVVAVDEVDDELATEIAEEARKHGIVERCFVRIVQREQIDDPSEKVRVFILYSGLVGAWKAVKTFDGRFFGGRNIRARFFSENSFTLGDWDA